MSSKARTAAAAAAGVTVAVAATVLAAAARRSHPLPEPLQRRAGGLERMELTDGVHLTPWFGRFGNHLVVASLTSPATTREELLDQLRVADAELRRGAHEAGLPEGTSTLAVVRSESNPDLRVATPELMREKALAAEGFGGTQVSQVVEMADGPQVAGGDAQPTDVSLPER